jgi:hypothetical protein
MPEKYRLKAFAMDERHLRATLALLAPKRRFDEKSGSSNRTDMLEEVVDWSVFPFSLYRLNYEEQRPPKRDKRKFFL